MLKLLIATDGSDDALRAVRHVADLAAHRVTVEAVVCNVQTPVMAGEIGPVASVEIAERRRTLAATSAFAAALAVLREAGIHAVAHEATGDPAKEIVAAADAYACDGIVMGRRGLGRFASLVGSSVSSEVVRKAHVPVTLVK
jgi:nucleotide-binding universal stress UspA family protein